MMKMKAFRFPRLHHFDVAAQLPIVISRDDNQLTNVPEASQQFGCLPGRGSIVDQIAQDDELIRLIFRDELRQALGD